jgi:hypothetical protein
MTMTDENPPVLQGGEYLLTVTLKGTHPDHPDSEPVKKIYRFTVSGEAPDPAPAVNPSLSGSAVPPAKGMAFSASASAGAVRQVNPPPKKLRTISTLACTRVNILSVFPPAGNQGDHSDLLPHLTLNRSTLPWEHRAVPERKDIPWLALLLFDEQEGPEVKSKRLDELKKDPVVFPEFKLGPGQHWEDQVTVIDVQRELLFKILPSGEALKRLAYVRPGTRSEAAAVIVGSQPPQRGRASIAHLVSLEGRYRESGEFDYPGDTGANPAPIRLLSIHSWRFACLDEQQNFTNLLLNLNSGTLRLPKNDNLDAEKYLAMGCVPLHHTTRLGDQTISWYHGPLVPGENSTREADLLTHPIQVSDELMRFHPGLSVFDVSYAAAWELGRFLALQSKTFATALFQWKESRHRSRKEPKKELLHVPFTTPAPAEEVPPPIKTWLERVEQLEGIPFNYLVPDEHMLQPGWIRFFYLDWLWLECLQKGALSLGRSTSSTDESMAGLTKPSRQTTGFLLRSEVVAGWPDLLVDGYTISSADAHWSSKLPLLRMDTLAKDILICLFDGKPDAVDIRLKPEGRSFRVSRQPQRKMVVNTQDRAERTNIEVAISQMNEPEEKVRFKLV